MKDLLGPRIGAFAIDYFVICIVNMAYIRAVGKPMTRGCYQVTGLPPLVGPIFGSLNGRSRMALGRLVGEKDIGLRVEKADGNAHGSGGALLRRVCDVFDFWTSFGLVAVICNRKNANGHRLGDMAAGTTVILTKKKSG